MLGFPVESFIKWMEGRYGPTRVTFNHVQEAMPNVEGQMVPIPGSDKTIINIRVTIQDRPDNTHLQQDVGTKLWELGVKKAAPMSFRTARVNSNGDAVVDLAYMVINKLDVV